MDLMISYKTLDQSQQFRMKLIIRHIWKILREFLEEKEKKTQKYLFFVQIYGFFFFEGLGPGPIFFLNR